MNISERHHHLDGFRAIAAMLVVVHHSFTASVAKAIDYFHLPKISELLISFTQSGVELFFVLSGVVILTPYLKKDKAFHVIDYFRRRIKRIYPPYFVALIFGSFVIWLVHAFPTWYSPILMPYSWQSTLSQLFMFNIGSQYYNLAWWSLQIELLFYLLAPMIIFSFPFFPKKRWKLYGIALFVLIGFAYLQIFLSKNYPSLYGIEILQLNLIKFIDYPICFLLGILIAGKEFSVKEALGFIIAGVLLVFGSLFYLPLAHSGFGFIYAGLIIMSFNRGLLRDFLSQPLLVWIGERSYSLFLTHFSVFYLINYLVSWFVSERNLIYGVMTRGLGVPVALLASMCLFYFVERRQARGLSTGNSFWPPMKSSWNTAPRAAAP